MHSLLPYLKQTKKHNTIAYPFHLQHKHTIVFTVCSYCK